MARMRWVEEGYAVVVVQVVLEKCKGVGEQATKSRSRAWLTFIRTAT